MTSETLSSDTSPPTDAPGAVAPGHIALPLRLVRWAEKNNITTLGALVAVRPSELERDRDVGKPAIRDAGHSIKARLGMTWGVLRKVAASPQAEANPALKLALSPPDGKGAQRRVRPRATRAARLLAVLRAAPAPVRLAEVAPGIDRHSLPDELIYFGPGLVGLLQHFPDLDRWAERLVPPAVRLMEADPPEREWHAGELLEALRADTALPAWLGEWHLALLLRRSGALRDLGRLRFSLANPSPTGERVALTERLIRILRAHGAPMPRADLVGALASEASVNGATVKHMLAHAPFMRCGRGRIGLLERDLPGGAPALAQATEHVTALLQRRACGLGLAALTREIALLSPEHARWTAEMCYAAMRSDARMQGAPAAGVGLSAWESARVATRPQLAAHCLDVAGGRLPLGALLERLEAEHGKVPDRRALHLLVRKGGGKIKGEWVLRRKP